MVARSYTAPDRGDIVWITFNPQAGREQKGRRPAFVVSPRAYNKKSGLALVCPITSQIKGYPFEVAISEGKISGTVLVDQIKSVDWKVRKVTKITAATVETTKQIQNLLSVLVS